MNYLTRIRPEWFTVQSVVPWCREQLPGRSSNTLAQPVPAVCSTLALGPGIQVVRLGLCGSRRWWSDLSKWWQMLGSWWTRGRAWSQPNSRLRSYLGRVCVCVCVCSSRCFAVLGWFCKVKCWVLFQSWLNLVFFFGHEACPGFGTSFVVRASYFFASFLQIFYFLASRCVR